LKKRLNLYIAKDLVSVARALKLNISAFLEESLIAHFEDEPLITNKKIKEKEKELASLKKLLAYQKNELKI